MLSLHDLKAIRDIDKGFVNISFSVSETVGNLLDYKFDLLRANAVNDEFKLIYSNIINFKCSDYSANLFNHEIKYFYKIRVTNTKTKKSFDSDYFTVFTANDDNYSFAINNMYQTYLDTVIGHEDFLLLKMKKTGEYCQCYDDIRNSSYEGECTDCFGTNFKGGFYPPINFKLCFFNNSSYQEELLPTGTFETQTPLQAWTSNYPVIQEGDILVDTKSMTRYKVMSWQPSNKNGYLIRQTFQITKIPESSVYYKIPLS